ncbi:MAG: MBOAT family protein [Xanthobacteraceae bacterium]
MLFNSPVFVLLFLPITLFGLFLAENFGSQRLAMVWLIIASAFFYGWFKAIYLLLLASLIVFNYLCGAKLSRDCQLGRPRRALLVFGIAVNFGVLAYFKYKNFFLDNANHLLGTHFSLGVVLLPLGISFFIFQKIAYLADSYKGETSSYTPLEFALFVMYFPQLIAGPIVHHSELIPQLRQRLRISPAALSAGLCLFTVGLLKKTVLADPLAHLVDVLFGVVAAGQGVSFLGSWCAAVGFTFQIYFDFSGYTDMALGLALMMGVRLPLNFDSPYKALNVIDFWRRWHMTLSRFLRDYVYIPLGGNRRGEPRRYVNLMITMLLGGLWHGAGWTFVGWGGLQGLYLVVNHGWERARQQHRFVKPTLATRVASRAFTFLAVVVSWVFFRAPDFTVAATLLKGMVGHYGFSGVSAAAATNIPLVATHGFRMIVAILAILLVAVWTLPNSQEIVGAFRSAQSPTKDVSSARAPFFTRLGLMERGVQLSLSASSGVIAGAALVGAMIFQSMRSTTLQQFIYFQF